MVDEKMNENIELNTEVNESVDVNTSDVVNAVSDTANVKVDNITAMLSSSDGRKVEGAKWYTLQVYSGCEKGVMETLKEKIAMEGMESSFENIVVPTHEVSEVKRGKKVSIEKKFFPRYVLIKMVMNDATWHLVNDTPRVMGFLGTRMKPQSMSERETEDMLRRLENNVDAMSVVSFEVGEQIKVCDGPFASFNGMVEAVEEDKQRLKVSVSIFGRPTQVDLEFAQVEKI